MAWHCGARGCRTHASAEHACANWRLAPITGSVGLGGGNRASDVRVIQGALNRVAPAAGGPDPRLGTHGAASAALSQAIGRFQERYFGAESPDGRVDVSGRTYRALARELDVKWILIQLQDQTVHAFGNGQRVYEYPCLTGDNAHPTNAGVFRIFRKNHPYRSRKYDVQMDYAMFFTADGKALHQYHGIAGLPFVRRMRQSVSDWFGSHGCVRLEQHAARTLYQWTPMGTRVRVR